MKNLFLSLLTLLTFSTATFGQTPQGRISGKILDPSQEAVSFVTVALFHTADSTLAKAAYTQEDGSFELFPVDGGDYWIKVSAVNFNTYSSPAIHLDPNQKLTLATIQMKTASSEVETVEIVAKKPMVTIKPDMTIFNVEGNPIAANSNALDLLRKSPGVMVDNSDNVQVLGRTGVRFLINGKPTPLQGQDLANFLKSLSSDQIEAIEIVTNPSAKYDAEGNAGVINIRLRRNQNHGVNATLNTGYSIGRYPKYNAGGNINYRGKKISAFGSYNLNTGREWDFIDLYREQGQNLIIEQEANNISDFTAHGLHGGLDYQFSPQHSIGAQVRGTFSDRNRTGNSFAKLSDDQGIISFLDAGSDETRDYEDQSYNVNYRYDNGKGATASVDIDYGQYKFQADTYQPNTYLTPDRSSVIDERNFLSIAPSNIDIKSIKTDWERPFLKGQLGFGAKVATVVTDNVFDFYQVTTNEEILDPERSNQFIYTENVNAAYFSYQRALKKINLQAGLRAEQTNSLGELTAMQASDNDRVERNYLSFFPSAGLTYQMAPTNSFRLNYSRRVDRPSYLDLNPFEYKLDELTYNRGNPFLQPQFSHNVQLTHTHKYVLNTTLAYSYTDGYAGDILDTTETSRAVQTTVNLANQQVVSLNVSYPHEITPKWSTFTTVTGTYTRRTANFGEGKDIDVSQPNFSIFHQSSIQLPKNLALQLSGYYQTKSLEEANFYIQPIHSLEAGLSWAFPQDRGNLQLSVSDITWGQQFTATQDYGGLFLRAQGGRESRQFKVRMSWNLGNTKVKAKKRKTGLEEESGRVKAN